MGIHVTARFYQSSENLRLDWIGELGDIPLSLIRLVKSFISTESTALIRFPVASFPLTSSTIIPYYRQCCGTRPEAEPRHKTFFSHHRDCQKDFCKKLPRQYIYPELLMRFCSESIQVVYSHWLMVIIKMKKIWSILKPDKFFKILKKNKINACSRNRMNNSVLCLRK